MAVNRLEIAVQRTPKTFSRSLTSIERNWKSGTNRPKNFQLTLLFDPVRNDKDRWIFICWKHRNSSFMCHGFKVIKYLYRASIIHIPVRFIWSSLGRTTGKCVPWRYIKLSAMSSNLFEIEHWNCSSTHVYMECIDIKTSCWITLIDSVYSLFGMYVNFD